ncbi:MAG: DUF3455 domain-containing protein [Xanthobacteraceae bacterium]
MQIFSARLALPGIAVATVMTLAIAYAEVPTAIAIPDEALVVTVHAEGAQIYECKRDEHGQMAWQFREPIATLLINGQTVGHHFAGPSWELIDGSTVTAKVVGRAPGATPKDIPVLKLEITSRRGTGRLSGVTKVQRLNTKGGAMEGSCSSPGTFASVPYAADYAFFQTVD